MQNSNPEPIPSLALSLSLVHFSRSRAFLSQKKQPRARTHAHGPLRVSRDMPRERRHLPRERRHLCSGHVNERFIPRNKFMSVKTQGSFSLWCRRDRVQRMRRVNSIRWTRRQHPQACFLPWSSARKSCSVTASAFGYRCPARARGQRHLAYRRR